MDLSRKNNVIPSPNNVENLKYSRNTISESTCPYTSSWDTPSYLSVDSKLASSDPLALEPKNDNPKPVYIKLANENDTSFTESISLRRSACETQCNCPFNERKDYENRMPAPSIVDNNINKHSFKETIASIGPQSIPKKKTGSANLDHSTKTHNTSLYSGSKRVQGGYKLSNSSSNASFFRETRIPFSKSKNSLSETSNVSFTNHNSILATPPRARPRSLYVPFVGYIENPPLPPGKEARDILMALTFTPISENSMNTQKGKAYSKPNYACVMQCNGSHKDTSSSVPSQGSKQLSAITAPFTKHSVTSLSSNCIDYADLKPHNVPYHEGDRQQPGQIYQNIPAKYEIDLHSHDTSCFGKQGCSKNKSNVTNRSNIHGAASYPKVANAAHCQVTSPASSHMPYLSASAKEQKNEPKEESKTINPAKIYFDENSEAINRESLITPLYFPTHPSNHSENIVVRVAHPPVLYPPSHIYCSRERMTQSASEHTSHICRPDKSKNVPKNSNMIQKTYNSTFEERRCYDTVTSVSSRDSFSSLSETSSFTSLHSSLDDHILSNHASTNGLTNKPYSNEHRDYIKLESIREKSPFSPFPDEI